jgi:DNA-binding FadR family transcriptional regulator
LVAQQLREQIGSGQITPGDTLPSEAEMLEQFGVSRPTLREALRVLESEGLIHLGRGSRTGATVMAPSIEGISQRCSLYLAVERTTMGELQQARMVLEPRIARLLASKPKAAVVQALQECTERQRLALKSLDYAGSLAAMADFHALLVMNSANSVLKVLAGVLQDISIKLHHQLLLASEQRERRQSIAKRCELATQAYQQLTKLIASGKAAEAESFWADYMDGVATFLDTSGLANVRVSPTPMAAAAPQVAPFHPLALQERATTPSERAKKRR